MVKWNLSRTLRCTLSGVNMHVGMEAGAAPLPGLWPVRFDDLSPRRAADCRRPEHLLSAGVIDRVQRVLIIVEDDDAPG